MSVLDRVTAVEGFRSLAHRNFRVFFVSQTVSFLGTWLQLVAQTLLIYRLTDSGTAVGLLTVCQFVPTLLLVAWAGVVIDRSDTRRLMTISSGTMLASSALLGVLVVTGTVTPLWVYLTAMVLGVANAFDNPGRRALVNELVPAEDVANAVSLNSTLIMATRIVGPALAGLMIATVGIGWCFLLNAATFVVAVAGLWVMDEGSLHRRGRVERARGQVREGIRYVWHDRQLRHGLGTLLAAGLISMNFQVILALYVKIGLDGSDSLYAVLSAVNGVGAMVCGLVLARRRTFDGTLIARMAVVYGVGIGLVALAPNAGFSVVPLLIVGFGQLGLLSGTNTLLQIRATPAMRGRVIALFSFATVGANPIGGALAGWTSEHIGSRFTLGYCAVYTIAVGLVALRAVPRPDS